MTVQTATARTPSAGNGVTTAFPTSFEFFDASSLKVTLVAANGSSVVKVLGTDYTVSGGAGNSGTVTMNVAPATGETLVVERVEPYVQPTALQPVTAFSAEVIEGQLDRLAMQTQQIKDLVDRSLKQPAADAANADFLPAASARANKFLAFDGDGDPIAAAGTSANLGPVSSYINTLLDDADAAAARATLSSAPRDPSYLTLGTNSELANERVLTPRKGLTATDGGAGASYTLDVDPAVFRGTVVGLTLANNGSDATNDIDIAVGAAVDDGQNDFMKLTSALTKQLDAAWAVGNNAGMRDTGSIADGTWYIFIIKRSDTGVVDVLASQSLSPTMPTNYDRKQRIGAILREAGAIVAFLQIGRWFFRKTAVRDINGASIGTAASSHTMSVPTGIRVLVRINGWCSSLSNGSTAHFYSPEFNDPTVTNADGPGGTGALTNTGAITGAAIPTQDVPTNTSRQIRARSDAAATAKIWNHGWYDFL